jgi:flagellar hook capping protein FlgD
MRCGLVIAVTALCTVGAPVGAPADPLTGGKSTVDCGGVSFVTAGGFQLGGSIGQPDAGSLIWMPFTIVGGFWSGTVGATVDVGDEPGPAPAPLPTALRILPPRPNPTSSFTRLELELPRSLGAAVAVYDVRGARVRTLLARELAAGRHSVEWDGRDDQAQQVGAGLYLIRVQLGSLHSTQKVAVVR